MLNKTLQEFTEELASSQPVPGGGGASALVGALAVALGNMVGNLTAGKKKYADIEKCVIRLNQKAEELYHNLLACIEYDADAFRPLAEAYALPKDSPEKEETMENALMQAAESPLKIMDYCTQAMEIIEVFAEKGSRIAVSDAGCAAALCLGAIKSAALNVYINTKSMKNREMAEALNHKADAFLLEALPRLESIYQKVEKELRS